MGDCRKRVLGRTRSVLRLMRKGGRHRTKRPLFCGARFAHWLGDGSLLHRPSTRGR